MAAFCWSWCRCPAWGWRKSVEWAPQQLGQPPVTCLGCGSLFLGGHPVLNMPVSPLSRPSVPALRSLAAPTPGPPGPSELFPVGREVRCHLQPVTGQFCTGHTTLLSLFSPLFPPSARCPPCGRGWVLGWGRPPNGKGRPDSALSVWSWALHGSL